MLGVELVAIPRVAEHIFNTELPVRDIVSEFCRRCGELVEAAACSENAIADIVGCAKILQITEEQSGTPLASIGDVEPRVGYAQRSIFLLSRYGINGLNPIAADCAGLGEIRAEDCLAGNEPVVCAVLEVGLTGNACYALIDCISHVVNDRLCSRDNGAYMDAGSCLEGRVFIVKSKVDFRNGAVLDVVLALGGGSRACRSAAGTDGSILRLPNQSCGKEETLVVVTVANLRGTAEGLVGSTAVEVENLRGNIAIEGVPGLTDEQSVAGPVELEICMAQADYGESRA